MIEKHFDVPFIAELALHEKQVQQNYRPIIAVHKWFARRPGTLFRGLLLAEFVGGNLRDTYYRAHDLSGKMVADPFMGGGTPLIEANRLGCDIIGYDINPMAYWIVRQEIEHLDLDAYRKAAASLRAELNMPSAICTGPPARSATVKTPTSSTLSGSRPCHAGSAATASTSCQAICSPVTGAIPKTCSSAADAANSTR